MTTDSLLRKWRVTSHYSRYIGSAQQLPQSPPASPRAVSPPLLRDTDGRLSLLLPAALSAVTAQLPLLNTGNNNNRTNKAHTNSSSFYSAASSTRGGKTGTSNSTASGAGAAAWAVQQGLANTCADVARYAAASQYIYTPLCVAKLCGLIVQ
jgi:hypothetical protein